MNIHKLMWTSTGIYGIIRSENSLPDALQKHCR